MSEPTDTSPLNVNAQVAAAYHEHYRVLEYVAVQKFRVPDEDVRGLIHEVFVAFIKAGQKVYDERAWLVGAMCNHCRLYWRAHGRDAGALPLDEEGACDADDVAKRVDVSTMLRRLPRRCREVLHLRFFEEYSSEEIANHFATTIQYARKMVYRCVCAARLVLTRITIRKGHQP
jgi:RNA polymerase sigma factor (sigma-70 family)